MEGYVIHILTQSAARRGEVGVRVRYRRGSRNVKSEMVMRVSEVKFRGDGYGGKKQQHSLQIADGMMEFCRKRQSE